MDAGIGLSKLQPHLFLPVDAGERCRVDWLLRIVEQLVSTSVEEIARHKTMRRIPDTGVVFLNIFISLI